MAINLTNRNKHWQTKSLVELGIFKRGKSKHRPRNDKALFDNGTIPLIQIGDIKKANVFIHEHSQNYNDFGLKQSKLWNANTLCITIAANIAETALLSYPMCFPDSVVGFNSFEDESSEVFMHYLFTYIKQIIQSGATGSIQDNINIDVLSNLKFKIPAKSYQDKICDIFFSLDQKIDLNNKINKELESMAKLIYDYWFVQFDFPISAEQAAAMGKPELEGRPYKSSGGKMVWSEELKREIPEGWGVGTLSDFIYYEKGGDWGKESIQGNYVTEVKCIRGADINGLNGKGSMKTPKRFILEKNHHKILESHDLIVEISGGSPTQSTGRLGFVIDETLNRFDSPIICSNFCKAIKLKHQHSLFNFKLEWERLYDHGVLFGFEGKTSGIKNLLYDSFTTNYPIVLPDDLVMKSFYQNIMPFYKKQQLGLKENQELSSLRDWLLPMLMNGQVKVDKV